MWYMISTASPGTALTASARGPIQRQFSCGRGAAIIIDFISLHNRLQQQKQEQKQEQEEEEEEGEEEEQ